VIILAMLSGDRTRAIGQLFVFVLRSVGVQILLCGLAESLPLWA
jgi:hypothetical protein